MLSWIHIKIYIHSIIVQYYKIECVLFETETRLFRKEIISNMKAT